MSPQTTSQQDLAGSARLSSQSTPIISGGEDLGDIETRGKELAARCWNDNEEFLAKDKIAEWLGGQYVFSFQLLFFPSWRLIWC